MPEASFLFTRNRVFSSDSLGLVEISCCGPDVTNWVLEEMMILEHWISNVYSMIEIWSRDETPWYEPAFVREKAYSYIFMLIIAPRLTYFPDTNFSSDSSCQSSENCRNTVTFQGRCIHSSEIGNFIYGFIARKFRMTWFQTLGGALLGNRGKWTVADRSAVKYGWHSLDQGWWNNMELPEDGVLADKIASDAPKGCNPRHCTGNIGHISLPPVTKEMNFVPIKELKEQVQVPKK